MLLQENYRGTHPRFRPSRSPHGDPMESFVYVSIGLPMCFHRRRRSLKSQI